MPRRRKSSVPSPRAKPAGLRAMPRATGPRPNAKKAELRQDLFNIGFGQTGLEPMPSIIGMGRKK